MGVIQYTSFLLVYVLTLFYITADKLFSIVFNIKYPVYWNVRKTKYLLAITWCLALMVSLSFCCVIHFARVDALALIHRYLYFYLGLEILFLVFTVVSYRWVPLSNEIILHKRNSMNAYLRTFLGNELLSSIEPQ